jgi:transcriptional regulator with XRE-family HTH domain
MEAKYLKKLKQLKLNIIYYRKKNGLTQERIAELLDISRTHMSNIEAMNMEIGLSLELLFRLSETLDVETAKLFEER